MTPGEHLAAEGVSAELPSEWRVRWDKAHEVAAEYNKALRSDDPRFRRAVQIVDAEGTVLFYRSAFLLRYRGFLLLFTAHHRRYVFDPDDLHGYAEFKQLSKIGTLKMDGDHT
jgi:hypothetical protein